MDRSRLRRIAFLAVLVVLAFPLITTAAPADQFDPDLVVQITSPRAGQRLQGLVDITGYAADRRSRDGSGLNERDIQIYLNDISEQNLFHYAYTGENSPEAAAALGPRFASTGFRDAWETCAFPAGSYTLSVWASSLVTPGARNYATVDVEVEPCEPATLLYQNDYSALPGGVWSMRLGPLSDAFARPVTWILGDFALGADARCVQADVDCRYGLVFREQPGQGDRSTNSMYTLRVRPTDGTFRLRYFPGEDPQQYVDLVPDTPSSAVLRGTATNRLGVLAQGDSLRVFVNGQSVGEARAPGRRWGQIGMAAVTEATNRGVEVQFDNVMISTPGPLDQLVALGAGGGTPRPQTAALNPIREGLDRIEELVRRGDCAAAANTLSALTQQLTELMANQPTALASVSQEETDALRARIQGLFPVAARCST